MTERGIEQARTHYFRKLPYRIKCTSCAKSKKKEAFGVRLMNREDVLTKGKEAIFLRQSYCTTCRH